MNAEIAWFEPSEIVAPVMKVSIGKGYIAIYKDTYLYLKKPPYIRFGNKEGSLIIGFEKQASKEVDKIYFGSKTGKVFIKKYEKVFLEQFNIDIHQEYTAYIVTYNNESNYLELTKQAVAEGKPRSLKGA